MDIKPSLDWNNFRNINFISSLIYFMDGKKMSFKITGKERAFVGVMTLLAIIFTNKWWLLFLNQVNPVVGFLIYYVIVYAALILMSMLGLIVFGVKIKKPLQIIGSSLVLFAFFLIFNWSSAYVGLVHADNVYFNNSEDGALFFIFSLLIHPTSDLNLWILWFITFPLSVFLISLLAVLLIHNKPRIDP